MGVSGVQFVVSQLAKVGLSDLRIGQLTNVFLVNIHNLSALE